jgi:hypothetical protein
MVGISHQSTVRVGDLTPARRAELEPQLVDIVVASYANAPRDVVADQVVFRSPDARLLLLWGGDKLLGFGSLGTVKYEVRGDKYCVIDAGVYVTPGTRGTMPRAASWGIVQSLRHMAANRGSTMCCVAEAASPVSYRAAARLLPSMHPRSDSQVPAPIAELVDRVVEDRGFSLRDGDPWRVGIDAPIRFQDEARMKRFVARSEDPNVDFFVTRNPGYLRGDWLVVYIPIDAKSLATMAVTIGRQLLGAALRRAGSDLWRRTTN